MAKTAGGSEAYLSKDHDYWTPDYIWQAILDFEGVDQFTCDPCASLYGLNLPAPVHYTIHDNGLLQEWCPTESQQEAPSREVPYCVFVNPPFGNQLRAYVKKALAVVLYSNCVVWLLLPTNRMETRYYHDLLQKCDFAFVLKGKLAYGNKGQFDEGNKATFGSMLVRLGPWPGQFTRGQLPRFEDNKQQRLESFQAFVRKDTRLQGSLLFCLPCDWNELLEQGHVTHALPHPVQVISGEELEFLLVDKRNDS
jgi:hypothetical protein